MLSPPVGLPFAGARGAAVLAGRDRAASAELKRRYLDAASADRKGGQHNTGTRYWVTYAVHVLGINPIQPVDADIRMKRMYEEWLEDMCVWIAEHRPSGRACGASAKSIGKYASEARAWYHRKTGGVLGMGAGAARISDILQGAKRLVPQPPPLERHGVAPADLAAGMAARLSDGSAASAMWRAALTFGVAALARGCEFALDAARKEVFELSEHITPGDVSFFRDAAGVEHARVRMRKRKDLKVLRGKHATVVLAGGGTCFDPVRELRAWMDARRRLGLAADGPLFCWPTGVMITVEQVRAAVRDVAQAAGRNPRLFGAHSLRIGGASAALAAGVPPALIRMMGRWSSDVYEIYCRMSVEAALQVGTALSSATMSTFEAGFHEEHLELLPEEVAFLAGPDDDGAA